MFYRIALLHGGVWLWLSYPIPDQMEAEMAFEYCQQFYPPGLLAYAQAEAIEGLEMWLKEKNTPTDRASFPEERGPGGDRDTPYQFTLPDSWKEQQAWLQLARIYRQQEEEIYGAS